MELIIKPTEACNFSCTFCSSSDISMNPKSTLDIDKIFTFLKRFPDTKSIIVNGGDPLMVPPSYYEEILNYIDKKELDTNLSFTTNLWDFYKKPEKWLHIFQHKNVGVCTSFNYGGTRRISPKREFTEKDFWYVSDLFLDKVGYRPDFISVINYDNEDTALKNIQLAKEMNVECKLNPAMASGRQSKPYPLAKMYGHYLNIIKHNLEKWEFNTKSIFNALNNHNTICPKSRNCDSSIRCLQPEGDYYSCGSFADDKEYSINFEEEMNSDLLIRPLSDQIELSSLKSECYSCDLFSLCNGCRKTIKDMQSSNMIKEHCSTMKAMREKLLKVNKYERTYNSIY